MDTVSEVMRSVGLNPAHLAQGTLYRPWGIDFPRMPGAAFHLVTRGACWLRSSHLEAPIPLEAGDLVLVTAPIAYALVSDLAAVATPIGEGLRASQPREPSAAAVASATTFICGIYRFTVEPIHPFFTELPQVIHLRAQQIAAHEPMYSAQRLLSAELAAADTEPGKSVLMDRLVDVMFYYILRQWVTSTRHQETSWIGAYQHPKLQKALMAIHHQPAHPWQVAELAQAATLSRAAFAQLFKAMVGETPMQYVTRVRMQQAMELLVQTEEGLEQIATRVGYATGFAFSKAFKRMCGRSPQHYRQQGGSASRDV